MSGETKKLTCGVCHAYLFEDDDVVYCPVCGAPHHRDCYKSIGHCAYEAAQGNAVSPDSLVVRSIRKVNKSKWQNA